MVNILICSESLQESEEIRQKVSHCFSEKIKATIFFEEKDTFLFYVEEHSPEPSIIIISLDFCKGGLKIAEKAKMLSPWAEIIFLCMKGHWTLDVYDVEHIYGLECPLSDQKLEIAIKRALEKIEDKRKTLFPIKNKGIICAVPIKEIQYLEQDKRIIYVQTVEARHSLYIKFTEIEQYKTDYFIRCHNSYAVNLLYVQAMVDSHFIMKNGKKIPISRSRKSDAQKAYEAFISRKPISEFT